MLIAALTTVAAIPADAAMNATISSTQGYSGLRLRLATDDYGNSSAYDFIAKQPPQSVYMIDVHEELREVDQFGDYVCGTAAQVPVGRLTWTKDTGTLIFVVPSLPKGQYHFLIDVGLGVSKPPCWRLDGPNGPLSLTVIDRPESKASGSLGPAASDRAAVRVPLASAPQTIAFGILAALVGISAYFLVRHLRSGRARPR